eukprot:99200-Hanusia_phi.AAC.3
MRAFVESFKPRSKTKVRELYARLRCYFHGRDSDVPVVMTLVLAYMRMVAVKSKKAGGEGIVHTRTHVKFDDSDAGTSDEEYEEIPAKEEEERQGNLKEAAKEGNQAFDSSLDDMAYLKAKVRKGKEGRGGAERWSGGREDVRRDGKEDCAWRARICCDGFASLRCVTSDEGQLEGF